MVSLPRCAARRICFGEDSAGPPEVATCRPRPRSIRKPRQHESSRFQRNPAARPTLVLPPRQESSVKRRGVGHSFRARSVGPRASRAHWPPCPHGLTPSLLAAVHRITAATRLPQRYAGAHGLYPRKPVKGPRKANYHGIGGNSGGRSRVTARLAVTPNAPHASAPVHRFCLAGPLPTSASDR